MIELRIVEHELGVKPEIQYRFMRFISNAYTGAMYKKGEIWSEWKTAPYVNAEDIKGENTDD
jgi:hypothetical protein